MNTPTFQEFTLQLRDLVTTLGTVPADSESVLSTITQIPFRDGLLKVTTDKSLTSDFADLVATTPSELRESLAMNLLLLVPAVTDDSSHAESMTWAIVAGLLWENGNPLAKQYANTVAHAHNLANLLSFAMRENVPCSVWVESLDNVSLDDIYNMAFTQAS